MSNYKHIITVKFSELSPSINDIYSGTEKKRVLKRCDGKTVGEIIDYWRTGAVALIQDEMKKNNIKKHRGVFRVDIGLAPRYATRRYDIDNYLKLPIDAFEKAGLIDNDVAVTEIFAKRLPIGSGVVVSVYEILDGKIYENSDGTEAYKIKNKKQKNYGLERYLEQGALPNEYLLLNVIPYLAQKKGCEIEYLLNNIKATEYIRCKTPKELLNILENKKKRRENLIKNKCSLKVIRITPMTYKDFCKN